MRASSGVSGHAQNGAMATLAILGAGSGRAQNTHGGERSRAPSPVLEPARPSARVRPYRRRQARRAFPSGRPRAGRADLGRVALPRRGGIMRCPIGSRSSHTSPAMWRDQLCFRPRLPSVLEPVSWITKSRRSRTSPAAGDRVQAPSQCCGWFRGQSPAGPVAVTLA